ncbi:YbaB/EbfC family nucleoid-associated protein [Daejeonella oryzae]|uniref:YbaB/EbfC family nucleoid-associated protein n=1 Tax=Daejeonella oryzae TaxID=1122943 RepID=UPI000411DFAF|nr:YbaB/EbfC family nucleoid-associated protein [Daejeonella oryzae]
MFDKLLEAQKKAEEIKKNLDNISVNAEIEGGKIKVHATASKTITSIEIDSEFLKSAEKEELEELLVTVMNKVLVQAETVSQNEMQAATRDMMGGLGNIFGK